jgi:hypothetical protein
MIDTSEVRPGDRITFLDTEDGRERTGEVTAFVPDASGCNAGFPGFVARDLITDEMRWGYLAQITEINGLATIV